MSHRLFPLALLVVTAAGCATPRTNAPLPPAPSARAAYEDRAAYFKSYTLDDRLGDHLFLHGGERVYFVEDLVPAVDPDSVTAVAANEAVLARVEAEPLRVVASTAMGVAGIGVLGLLASPFLLFVEPLPSEVAFGSMAVGGTVAGVGVGVGFIAILVNGDAEMREAEATDRAIRTYQQSLSDRVGINRDANGRLVDTTVDAPAAPLPTEFGAGGLGVSGGVSGSSL